MRHTWFFALCFLLFSASGLGQSTPSAANDTQGMQALVAEVRQLRKDLQTTNANALKAQILLNRLQLQEGIVARASEHLNEARGTLAGEAISIGRTFVQLMPDEPEGRGLLALMLHCEARRAARYTGDGKFVPLDQQDPNLWSPSLMKEAEEHLRTEQAKLGGLEDRVDRLEKDLGSNPH